MSRRSTYVTLSLTAAVAFFVGTLFAGGFGGPVVWARTLTPAVRIKITMPRVRMCFVIGHRRSVTTGQVARRTT